MPYIHPSRRDDIDHGGAPATPGELNYLFTSQAVRYLRLTGISYTSINDVIGALECCKLELYRRLAAPYEDDAIVRNGDVYP